jgi:hypothetical protein
MYRQYDLVNEFPGQLEARILHELPEMSIDFQRNSCNMRVSSLSDLTDRSEEMPN